MSRVEFSIPFWKTFEVRADDDTSECLEKAKIYADGKDSSNFLQLQCSAQLLQSAALSFLHSFPPLTKAFAEGSIYCLTGETTVAKAALFDHGEVALKRLGLSCIQLFLGIGALYDPKSAMEFLKKKGASPITVTPGMVKDPTHITNILMFKNRALEGQMKMLLQAESATLSGETVSLVDELLKRNSELEVGDGAERLLLKQDVEYQKALLIDGKKNWDEEKAQLEARVKELEQSDAAKGKNLEKLRSDRDKRWEHLKGELGGQLQTTERVKAYMERLEKRPHMYR